MQEATLTHCRATGRHLLVWDAESAELLRRARILAAPIGSLPRCPRQNRTLHLPCALTPEQAEVAAQLPPNAGRCRVVAFAACPADCPPVRPDAAAEYAGQLAANYAEAAEVLLARRRLRMTPHAAQIAAGRAKKRKRAGADAEANAETEAPPVVDLEAEALAGGPPPLDRVPIHLPTGTPDAWLRPGERLPTPQPEPPVSTARGSLRLRAHSSLWRLGYHLTSGAGNFGADFLLYRGEPLRYHATHLVLCCPEGLPGRRRLACHLRLANDARKLLLLALPGEGGEGVEFRSFAWRRGEVVELRLGSREERQTLTAMEEAAATAAAAATPTAYREEEDEEEFY